MSYIGGVVVLLIIAVCILLQVFFSKRQSKWLGLILPAIFLIYSLIAAFGLFAYTTKIVTRDGVIVNYLTNNKNLGSLILQSFIIFAEYNIPTIVLLGIYASCREKMRKKDELKKMNIQDLE